MKWSDQAVLGFYAVTAGLLYRKLRHPDLPLFEDSWVATWRRRFNHVLHIPQVQEKEMPLPADVVIVEYSTVRPHGETIFVGNESDSQAFLEAHTKRAATPGTYAHAVHATYAVYTRVLHLDPRQAVPA